MQGLFLYGYYSCVGTGYVIGIFIGLGIDIWLSCWSGRIAQRKGYSYGAFWALTFFTGIIGIIIAACLDDKTKRPQTSLNKDVWTCTKCGSSNDGGIYCLKCGEKRHSMAGWLCMECLTYNDDGDFCSKCGSHKLGATKKEAISWRCEYCGRVNSTDTYQCQGCGSRREK